MYSNETEHMMQVMHENDCLKSELNEAMQREHKINVQFEEKCKEVSALKRQIKYLEGQVNAYEYCINCRR